MKIVKNIAVIFLALFCLSQCRNGGQPSDASGTLPDSLSADTVKVNPFIDSLKADLASAELTSKIDIVNRLAEEYRNIDLAFQERLWKEGLVLSEKNNYPAGMADALHNKAIGFYKKLNFDSASATIEKSLEIARASGDKRVLALALSWKGEIQRASRNPDAEKTYMEALHLAEQINDHTRQAFCLTYIAAIHRDKLDFNFVLNTCRKAISEAGKAGYTNLIAANNGFIGDVYKLQGQPDSAQYYYGKVVNISWINKNYNIHAFNAANLGETYRLGMNFSKALDYYNQALKSAEKLDDKWRLAYIHISIGECYRELQKDFKKAREYYEKAIRIAEASGDIKNYTFASITLVHSLVSQGKFSEAEVVMEKIKAKQKIEYDRYNNALILQAYGDLYQAENKIEDAIKIYQAVLDTAVQMKEESMRIGAINSLCRIFLRTGRVSEAAKYEKELSALVRNHENKGIVKNLANVLSEYYRNTGNYKDAYNMYVLYAKLHDSLNNSAVMKKFAASEYKAKEEKLKADQVAKESEFRQEQIKKEEELKRQKTIRYSFTIAFAAVTILLFFIFKNYREKKRVNAELEAKNELIEKQKEMVEEKQKEIVDSINYAKRIQYTLLAHDNLLKENLDEYFVFFKPRDIVSGDFYWATRKDDAFYIAVCDSTGHGVPGAFMSLLNINFLNEAINEKNITAPNEVFDHVRKRLIQNISQEGQKDGMDGILMRIEKDKITYASANNAPLLIAGNMIVEQSKDKMPIGIGEKKDPFRLFEIKAQKGGMLYLYTDGFADQFGGDKGKKFKYTPLNNLLLSVSALPMDDQKQRLYSEFENWKGHLEQVDDVCIIGIRL